jgi:ribonuclease HI
MGSPTRNRTRKSQSGWVVRIANGAVDWSTKAQKSVALSSCEAEYVAASEAFREVLWMRQLLQELKVLSKSTAVTVRMDSTSAMALIRNPVGHQRTKHIDIKYHFVRNLVESGVVDIIYVPTENNVADLFTKAVSVATFLKLSKLLVKE